MRGFCEDACEILVSLIEMCKVSKGFAAFAIVGKRIVNSMPWIFFDKLRLSLT